jgi:hypothetical protein
MSAVISREQVCRASCRRSTARDENRFCFALSGGQPLARFAKRLEHCRNSMANIAAKIAELTDV